jgi:hypothetical protein
MRFAKPVVLCAALLCAQGHAAAPAYDGRTPMIEMGPVWFDPALSADEQLSIARMLVEADAHIAAVYGERRAPIRLIWCKTDECTLYFAGTDRRPFTATGKNQRKQGGQFTFTFPAVVVLGRPRSFTGNVLKHEMSHMEFRTRLHGASIPAWFNEGVATWVGGEHDSFCRPGMKGVDDLSELERGPAWLAYTNEHRDKSRMTYCQARNEVADWIAEHGGFAAVLDLLAKRAKGTPFSSLYGRERARLAAAAPPATDDDETD